LYHFSWDASALARLYIPETGFELVRDLYKATSASRSVMLTLGLGEISSVLRRKRNDDSISKALYGAAILSVRTEFLNGDKLKLISITDALVLSSLPHIDKYSINATDALILQSSVLLASELRIIGNDVILVTADQRLLKAAQTEGLLTLNPETDTRAQLEAFLNG
jgi:predicted nucleic acid-binding protein